MKIPSLKALAALIRLKTSSEPPILLSVFVITLAKIFDFGLTTAVAKKFLALSCNSTILPDVSCFVLRSRTNSLSYTQGNPARILSGETFGFKRIIECLSSPDINYFYIN